ncbi:restriction endonuclease subunit S [Streptomyces sioyaensis]|uniref:restriction endonuclease subunit S n=1 Tax=Streptomyces sioyaensis TaxID=67364 RepID=UPI0036C270ED
MTNGFESIPAGWSMSRLDRVATVNARIGWKSLTATEYQPEGYAFLATPNIKNHEIDYRNVNYISEFRYEESPELKLKEGDVLLAKDGNTLGIVNIVRDLPRPSTVNGSIAVLRPFGVYPSFLRYIIASDVIQGHISSVKDGMGVPHLFQRDIKRFALPLPPESEQLRIASFLDAETGKMNDLVRSQARLVEVLDERINHQVLDVIGRSELGDEQHGSALISMRWILRKHVRPTADTSEVITAFRDGQVTARSLRRAEGYTNSASSEPQGQHVHIGDVVVHGLDGFAGAIGTAEAEGNCSPVNHVLTLRGEGDSSYYGRLLRILALQGYLTGFSYSTRERAFDFRNWDMFGRIPIPIGSVSEQRRIGHDIRNLRPIRNKVDQFAARIAERRQALITAAVTGQFDVTTASGRNVTDGVTP